MKKILPFIIVCLFLLLQKVCFSEQTLFDDIKVNSSSTMIGAQTNFSSLTVTNFMRLGPTVTRQFIYQNGVRFLDFDLTTTGNFFQMFSTNGNIIFFSRPSDGAFVFNDLTASVIAQFGGGDSKVRSANLAEAINFDGRYLAFGNGNQALQWHFGNPAIEFLGTTTNMGNSIVMTNLFVNSQIGITPRVAGFVPLAQVHAVFTNEVTGGIQFLGDVYGPTNTPNFIGRRARGTISSPSAIQADDLIAAFTGRGFGSTIFSTNSNVSIGMHSSQVWTDANHGTYMRFSTTSNNTAVLNEAMRITDQGNLGIGTTNALAKLHVVGQSMFRGGVYFNFVTTATNYTDSVSDNFVSYRGVTATAVTNFLPAINGTTITNGFVLTVKDGANSANLTNIVIFPSGSDTVTGSASRTMNASGQSISLIVDGPNKNWLTW